MFNKKTTIQTVVCLIVLIVVGLAGRLLPHPPNVVPISALALFISAYFGMKYSIPAVLLVMVASDAVIGFYSWPILLSVYGSFALAGFLGSYLYKHKNIANIFVITLGSSLLFFLVTNWAVWQFGSMYAHTWSGLVQSYTMALPFFRNSLFGDLVYTGVLFGVVEVVKYFFLNRSKIYINFEPKQARWN